MTQAQRESLRGMTAAILAVPHAPPDIRLRAESLRDRLDRDEASSQDERVPTGRDFLDAVLRRFL